MAISDNYAPDKNQGNGSTVEFSGSWKVLNSSYFRCALESVATGVQTLLTLGSDYDLEFGESGYKATLHTAPTSAYYVVRYREVALDQTDPYRTSKGFQGKVIENSFDKLTAIEQDQNDQIERSIRCQVGDGAIGYIPSATSRALKYLAFDASGNPIASDGTTDTPISAAMTPVVSAATLPDARTAMGLGSASTHSEDDFLTSSSVIPLCSDGRLTLTSGSSVVDTSQSGTVYYTPHIGNRISLYDTSGSKWVTRAFSEISVSAPATTNTVYDVFAYWTGSAVAIEALAWSSQTARATAIVRQDGVYVKSGDASRKYLGSFMTSATSAKVDDTKQNRYLFNMYNRVNRRLERRETTLNWTYTTPTWRFANGNSANYVGVLLGVDEDAIELHLYNGVRNSNVNVQCLSCICLDGVSQIAADYGTASGHRSGGFSLTAGTAYQYSQSNYYGTAGIGYHYYTWVEYSQAKGTTTWEGSDSGEETGLFGMARL